MSIRSRLKVSIQVDGEMNARVAELLADVLDRSTVREKQGSKGMAQIVKPSSVQTGLFERSVKVALRQIHHVLPAAIEIRK